LLLPVLVIAAATGGTGFATPTAAAVDDIPPDYLVAYEQAELVYDVPWEVLAGIGKVECDHGRDPAPACWKEGAVNEKGAGGPMQFLAGTWQTYGVDADEDGTADRWDPVDAIFAAANLLAANGAPDDIPKAVHAYNPSDAYVEQVLTWADQYRDEAPLPLRPGRPAAGTVPPAVAGNPASAAAAAVGYALAQLGTPYRWGGEEPGGFDCSGLAQAAYQAAGISLPRVAQDQYDAGPPVGAREPLQPGDLVFFGSDTDHVDHVGIVVSPGEMVDAPHSGAVVRIEPYSWPDYLGATRPAGTQP
jgi:cell wall-associated NlpC family hydrolase